MFPCFKYLPKQIGAYVLIGISETKSLDAGSDGLSLTELIYKHVESEIRASVIPDGVTGFRVKVVNEFIKFELQGRTFALTTHEALRNAVAVKTAWQLIKALDSINKEIACLRMR